MEKMNENPRNYRKCGLFMRNTQPIMKKMMHKNNQLPVSVIHDEFSENKGSLKQIETTRKNAEQNALLANPCRG